MRTIAASVLVLLMAATGYAAADGGSNHPMLSSEQSSAEMVTIIPAYSREKICTVLEFKEKMYLRYVEGGTEGWIATAKSDVREDDVISFQDVSPVAKFEATDMGMTFENIRFVPSVFVLERDQRFFKTAVGKYVFSYKQYLQINDKENALRNINEAINLSPSKAELFAARADLYKGSVSFTEKDYEAKNKELCGLAIADYSKAITLNSKKPGYYAERADLWVDFLCSFDQKEKAVADYNEAIKLDPNVSAWYVKKGNILGDIGQLEGMEDCAKYAIKIDNKSYDARLLYSKYYKLRGNFEKALNWCAKGLEINGGDRNSLLYLYDLVAESKVFKQGIEITTKLLQRKPALPLYVMRADFYGEIGSYAKGIADYTSALKYDPSEMTYYKERARYYLLVNDRPNALADTRKACQAGDEESCKEADILEADIKRGPDWVLVGKTDSASWYFNKKTVKRNGSILEVWAREEITDYNKYKQNTSLSFIDPTKASSLSYRLKKYEINCNTPVLRSTSNVMYSTSGNVIYSDTYSSDFNDIVPDSIGEAIVQNTCDHEKHKSNKKVRKRK